MRETDVQKAIMDLLAARGFRVLRRNVAGLVKMAKGGYMRVGTKGQADLYGWHKGTGRHLEVEVKVPGELPTPHQSSWLHEAHMDECISFWADSVQMAEDELKRYGY